MLNASKQLITLLVAILVLASCGGGSGSAPAATTRQNLKITFNASKTSLPTNDFDHPITLDSPYVAQVNVSVTFASGTPVPDGTVVSFRTSDALIAPVSTLDDPETTDVNEFATYFGSTTNESSGGLATFFVHSRKTPGTVTLTASATDPNSGRTTSANMTFTIEQGSGGNAPLTINPDKTQISVNSQGVPWFPGSPYVIQANINFVDAAGNPVTVTTDSETPLNASVSPASLACIRRLDDLSTEEDESAVCLASTPFGVSAGQGVLYIESGSIPGTGTLNITGTDPSNNQPVSATLTFEVVDSSVTGVPNNISITNSGQPIYVQGSGGNTTAPVSVLVTDGSLPVSDPSSGSNRWNNVQFTLNTQQTSSGEELSGVNAQGQTVSGSQISLATTSGAVNALLRSGSNPNIVTVTATADRADNNVDNGIQEPITATGTYNISDGRIWAIDITGPDTNALLVNRVNPEVQLEDANNIDPDGTYSLIISATAVDKGGNPALPGQLLHFGLIDSPLLGYPQSGSGVFAISGNNGDPQEGGFLFSQNNVNFLTTAGGVQPGDTLIVFGEESPGNEDLETAASVQAVNSSTTVTIAERFNYNDATGAIRNDGPVLPFVVGRAVDGSVSANATTDNNGVATIKITYPVSKLGKLAAIYAEGTGAPANGNARTVTDAEIIAYPGISQFGDNTAGLVVFPNVGPGNASTSVTVCAYDALGSSLAGVTVNFAYVGPSGTGTIDGQTGSGSLSNPTDGSGCTTGQVTTTGIDPTLGEEHGFNFFAAGLNCLNPGGDSVCMLLLASDQARLVANPSVLFGDQAGTTVTLTLYGSDGSPQAGISITGSCTATAPFSATTTQPPVTNNAGQTAAAVTADVSILGQPAGYAECTYTAATGQSVTVPIQGIDCNGVSPLPPGCN